MSQKTKYIINSLLWTLISTVLTGALFQTFLLEKGIPEERVGTLVSAMQFVQMGVIFVFSRLIDRVKNIIRLTALSHLLYLPLFGVMAALCFVKTAWFPLLAACAGVACVGAGLYNVLSYKIPYHIMKMELYGKWTGIASVVSAGFMLLLTAALSLAQKRTDYFATMRFFFPAVTGCALLFVFATASYRQIETAPPDVTKEKKISLLKYKPFTLLILPNLMRGFCAGMIAMAVTVGYTAKQLNADSASILLVITQTVGIPANLLYVRLTGREPILILLGSVGIFGAVAFMGSCGTVGFLVLYGLAYFCVNLVNVAVPVLVTKIADYRVVGQYNGWRILLNTAGIFLAGAVCVPTVRTLGATAAWVIAGGCQLLSGIAYYCYCKKNTRSDLTAEI